jgi:hypothetical protein
MTQVLVLYALFALATPILVIVLYIRYSSLRDRMKAAEEDIAKQAAALRHEIADLRKQLAALKVPGTTAALGEEHRPAAAPSHSAPMEPVKTEPRPFVPLPSVVVPLPRQFTPGAPVEPKKTDLPPSAPVVQPPAQPAQPPQKEEPKVPSAPAHPAPEPQMPVAPPTPPRPISPAPVKPEVPPAPPAKVPTPEVPAAASSSLQQQEHTATTSARVSAPSAYSPLRIPSSKPSLQERMKRVSAFEEALGTNWLQKLGIVLLVLGVASFGIYELAALGSFGKVMVLYLAAAVLLGGGIYLEKRERYQLLGRTGIGGGWALFFFTTFAMYFVPSMRVLHSAVLDSVLMLLVAVAMAAHTLRYRSQLVTGLAFLLGYSTVALSQDTVYSLSAGVILAIGLVAIVLKMRWYQLEVFGILSGYLNHLYWLYRILGIEGARGRHFPEYTASTALLFFYWLVFRISYLWRKPNTVQEEHTSTAAAILNSTLLLATLRFQSVHPELAYIALLAVGAVELAFGQIVKYRREAFVVLSVIGAALLLAAAPAHYAGPGNDVAILWLVGAEVFLLTGVLVKEAVFRRIGLFTGLLVAAWLAYFDLRSLIATRSASETVLVWAATLFGTCAIAFYLNSLAIGRKWSEVFESSPDRELLVTHSYLGALCGAVAAWAFFTHDWTAVAFAGIMLLLAALAQQVGSPHLQLQYLFFGVLVAGRAFAVNLHLGSPNGIHVRQRLLTLPLLAAAFYGTAKLAALRETAEQRFLRGLFAAAGSLALGSLIWLESPELWRPVALIAFAIALAEAGRALKYPALAWHTHFVCFLAATTVLVADPHHFHQWHDLPVRALSGLAVVAGFYWLAWRGTKEADLHLPITRAAYTWAAAALMLWALFDLLQAPWIAVGWIGFAVALALVARWMKYEQLAWQANIVALCATLRTIDANYELTQTLWAGIGVRVVTISLVAAGLYFVSRKGSPHDDVRRVTTFVHSFSATGLLAALMFFEAPNGWLVPLWAAFALVLALVDRKWNSDELPWQAHILSLLAFARAFTFNLHSDATWHHWSVRLLSVALTALIFYAMAAVVRIPEEWKEKDFHHAYSWAASVLASMVLWHELKPLGVAVGWAAFGLILFEYGLLRKISQFRYQAYIALIAAFIRIFFVNLTAGQPGEFWGVRLYTILPLVLIFFFVYAQLPGESKKEAQVGHDRDWHFDVIVGCLGTAAVAALLRFQFIGEWVVTAWAALVLVLFAAAYFLKKDLFLYQAIALTVLTFARGVAHNLFGSSYFSEGDWKGRYVVVGIAVALLLASLAFAFPLRKRAADLSDATLTRRIWSALARRPEQLQFFAGVVLLWLMLTVKMNAGMKTVAWGIEGVGIIVLALLVKERSFRLTGLGLLLLCVAKIMALDAWGLHGRDRYITLIVVGSALILVHYLYMRYRETIRQFL